MMTYSTCPTCRGTVVHESGFAHVCYDLSPLEKENAALRLQNDEAKRLLREALEWIGVDPSYQESIEMNACTTEIKKLLSGIPEKRNDRKMPVCDKEYAPTEDTYGYCGREFGHEGPCGRG